ncbi:unnamed protein product [Phytophthora fragariaefolia]|uniref:Unnamed protein product n=1 Tax=Phytophthora fragariaefolia TaxID=1490495 RepID=A0A9W6XE92_9STRA|nr:unnamed protein product [Phytophthora fragariaefolia]
MRVRFVATQAVVVAVVVAVAVDAAVVMVEKTHVVKDVNVGADADEVVVVGADEVVAAEADEVVVVAVAGLRRNQSSARKEATSQSDDESSSGNESGGNNGSEDEWNMDSASDTCDDDGQSSDTAVDVSTSGIEPPPNLPVTVNGDVASDDQTLSQ